MTKKACSRQLILLDEDVENLQACIQNGNESAYCKVLQEEVSKAAIVPKSELPHDVVTMNSKVRIFDMDSKERISYTIVFPDEADIDNNRISILAPVGTALIGYRKGDTVRWNVPSGTRSMAIERVEQPAVNLY